MSSENIINNEEGGSNHRANRTAAITGDLSHPILQLLGTGGTLSIGENGRNNTATTIESSSYTSRSQNAGIFLDSSQQQQALLLAALQQQQALQQQVSTNALDAVSMDRDANVQAQALLLHHEGQLRAIRLLLEQQQQQGNYQHQNPLLLASSNAVAAAEAAKNSVLEAMGTTSSAARSLATGQTDHSSEEDKDSGKGIKEASQGGKKTARGRNSRRKTCEDRGADERKLKRPEADSDEEEQNNEDEQEDEQDSDSEREADDDKLSDEEYFKDFGANDDNRAICETFPLKLYRMLHEVEKSGKGDVVSFLPHGKSFAVRKPRAFVEDIMPKYFTTARLASFQRQLNLYGFRRINEGREKGAYTHDFFIRSKRALSRKIKRQKTRVKSVQNQSLESAGLTSFVSPSQNNILPNLLAGSSSVGFPNILTGLTGVRTTSSIQDLLSANTHSHNHNQQHGLGQVTGLSLAGLPGGNLGPLSSVTANGTNEHDLGHAALQHALRRSLLGDNSSLSHYNQSLASGGVLSSQHHHHQQLQSKLQGEERELLLQHLRRQQEQFQQQQQQQQCLQRDQLQQGQERTLGRRDQD